MALRFIELDRLALRVPELNDADEMYRNWTSDAEVTRYLIWTPHGSVEETVAYITHVQESWLNETEFTWLISLRSSGDPIGTISLRKSEFKAGIGYALARRYWGNGYMSEAARKVLSIAFSDSRIRRVDAVCDVDNIGSARVMQKLGMTCEGILRRWLIHPSFGDQPRDCYSFSVCR